MEAEEEISHAYLARHPDLAGLPVATLALCGAVAQGILDAVQAEYVDLVVMSSHGRSGFRRLALGSVTERVIRHAPVPILVLHRPRATPVPLHTSSPFPQSPLVVVTLDGSE